MTKCVVVACSSSLILLVPREGCTSKTSKTLPLEIKNTFQI